MDPVRELHTGKRPRERPHQQAGHTEAPDYALQPLRAFLHLRGRPHTDIAGIARSRRFGGSRERLPDSAVLRSRGLAPHDEVDDHGN